jgi:hypothetical protein
VFLHRNTFGVFYSREEKMSELREAIERGLAKANELMDGMPGFETIEILKAMLPPEDKKPKTCCSGEGADVHVWKMEDPPFNRYSCVKCGAVTTCPEPKSTCACGEPDCDGEGGMIGKPDPIEEIYTKFKDCRWYERNVGAWQAICEEMKRRKEASR